MTTAAAVPTPTAPARTTMISVMSWFTPLGELNGERTWKADQYRYRASQAGQRRSNWRWPLPDGLPDTLAAGSDAYLALQETAARTDLRLLAEAGFDVALYDMLPWPDWDPAKPLAFGNAPLAQFPTFLAWLRAAEGLPIQVGLFPDIWLRSGDYPQGRILTVAEWAHCLGGALELSNGADRLWRIDDRPAIFHFGTSYLMQRSPDPTAAKPDRGWGSVLAGLRKDGHDPFFLADIRPHEPERLAWDGIVDAVHCFHPAGPARYLREMQAVLARTHQLPYVWSTSIGYYNAKVWTPPDFRRIHDTYTMALAAGARYVHAMTWNDFNEDTDIAPSAFKGRCLLDVHAYYNRWFKDGHQPETWPERVIIGYPRAIPAQISSVSVSWGTPAEQRALHRPTADELADPDWGDWRQPPYKPTAIWWAHLDAPRSLIIDGVGTIELPAGLSMGELGQVAPGPLRVTLSPSLDTRPLPTILRADHEREYGLHYRFHDLLHLDGRERGP